MSYSERRYLREFTENDWNRFRGWCIEEGEKNRRPGYSNVGEQAYNVYKNNIVNKVNRPEADPYYWRKQGFQAFIDFITSFKGSKKDDKKFIELFGKSAHERLTGNDDLIPAQFRGAGKWVMVYNRKVDSGVSPEQAQKELSETLKELFDKYQCYTDEELEEIKYGTEIVCEENGWTVVKIYNYPASEYYGRGSGWCTTGHYSDPNGRGDSSSGQSQFNNYMSNHIDTQRDAKGKYYLMYLNKDGRKYNVLQIDDSYTWVGTKGKDSLSNLPDDVPITPLEVLQMSNPGKNLDSRGRVIPGSAYMGESKEKNDMRIRMNEDFENIRNSVDPIDEGEDFDF